MGELILGAPVAGLASANRITPDDVRMLRGEVFQDGVVTRGEAESLLALDAACEQKCDDWSEFFVEALTDYLVHQEKPAGYISQKNADWLIRAVSSDGVIDTRSELELLVRTIEISRKTPDMLAAFALQQVALAVLDGEGSLASGRGSLTRGRIGQAEAGLIRRVLYGQASGGSAGISRAEAEVLFELNDRTVAEDNHPEWDDLFVKALANYLMCASGYTPPTRAEALAREEWLDQKDVSVSRFFNRMVSGGLSGIFAAYSRDNASEAGFRERNERFESENRIASVIDGNEAEWLANRIGRDGKLHENEAALIRFLRKESPDIHPALKPLLDKVA